MKPYLTNWSIKIFRSDFNSRFIELFASYTLSDGTEHSSWMEFSAAILNDPFDIRISTVRFKRSIREYINKLSK